MILLRFFVLVFNVAVISFLIYRILQIVKQPMETTKKTVIIISGILLLLAPLGIFFRFFSATPQYLVIYPVAITLFLYMIREVK
jgi:hypothetical protein